MWPINVRDCCRVYVCVCYSWPCLHQWLETRPTRKLCPVCKAGISKESVVPLYGRGAASNGTSQDPREKVPPRPQGQRPEPTDSGVINLAFSSLSSFTFTLSSITWDSNRLLQRCRLENLKFNCRLIIAIATVTVFGSACPFSPVLKTCISCSIWHYALAYCCYIQTLHFLTVSKPDIW